MGSLSPFMIGPYYKLQMTSLMSITHRASGVFLSIIGAPLLLNTVPRSSRHSLSTALDKEIRYQTISSYLLIAQPPIKGFGG